MDVKKYKKEELVEVAEKLTSEDISELIKNLSSIDDKLRYPSFLILQHRSSIKDDVYPYFNNFVEMLDISDNSYFRTIGIKMIASNIKWDKSNKFKNIIDKYLSFCQDEKLITARLCIQSLETVIKDTDYNKEMCDKIVKSLISINISKRPDTNKKVMTTDIVNVLLEIYKNIDYKDIYNYLDNCLNNDIIDKKLKNEIQEILQ